MNIIKVLSSITVEDLKNIDWESVKDRLISKPGLLINIALIIFTFFFVVSSFSKQGKKSKSLKFQVKELKEKADALDKLKLVQTQYNQSFKNIPENISTNELIETLSEFAVKWNIQILSFSPAEEKSDIFVNITQVKIDVASENYANIILFMHDIENSPFMIRVGSLSSSEVEQIESARRTSGRRRGLVQPRQASSEIKSKKFIQATIEIESVKFNYG